MIAIPRTLALAGCSALVCLALSGCAIMDDAGTATREIDQAREDVDRALSDAVDEVGSSFGDIQNDLENAFSDLQDSASSLSAATLLGKASVIEFADAQTGEALGTCDDPEAIARFASGLDLGTWQPAAVPVDAHEELVATFRQRETVKLGESASDARMATVCTLTTYEGADAITLDVRTLSLSFSVPSADLAAPGSSPRASRAGARRAAHV